MIHHSTSGATRLPQAAAGPVQWLLKAVRLFLTGTVWFYPPAKQGVKKMGRKNKTKLRYSICSLVFF